jgi:hypothetical protein
MTNISTVYDTLITSLATLFSTKTRIPNPYSLEDNPHHQLTNGYGLKVNGSTVADSEFCTVSQTTDFGIVFTKQVVKLDSDNDGYDSAIKELLEASNTLQINWLKNNQIGIEANITQVNFINTSGVDFVVAGKNNFVTIEVGFSIQVRENLV